VIDPERLKRVEAAGPDELFYRRWRAAGGSLVSPPIGRKGRLGQ
jgi:hypothetical protein